MADCEHYQELISLYVDGEIAPDEKAGLLAHLKTCPDCAALLSVYSEVSRLLSDDADPPEALAENVMRRVREQREGRFQRSIRMRRTVLRIAATAACAALLLIPLSSLLRQAGAKKDNVEVAMYGASGRAEDASDSAPASEYSSGQDGVSGDINQKSSEADVPNAPVAPDAHMLAPDLCEPTAPSPEPCDPSTPYTEAPPSEAHNGGYDSLEALAADYAALVYAESFPEELEDLENRTVYTLPDGCQCAEITLEELALLKKAGYRVDAYSETSGLALVTFPS